MKSDPRHFNVVKRDLTNRLPSLVSLMEDSLAAFPPNLDEARKALLTFLFLLKTLEDKEKKEVLIFLHETYPELMARFNRCNDQIGQAIQKGVEETR